MMKKILALLLALTFVLSLAACGTTKPSAEEPNTSDTQTDAPESDASDSSESNEAVELTFWTFVDPENGTSEREVVLKKLIEGFENEHPGVTVTVNTTAFSDLDAKFMAACVTGDAPDLIQFSPASLSTFIDAGYLEAFEDNFMSDWSDDEIALYNNANFNVTDDAGKHYVMTLFESFFLIYYRADLFEANDIDPASIKTWDDLFAAAEKLSYVDENGTQVYGFASSYGSAVDQPSNYLFVQLINQDGSILNEDGTPNAWSGELGQAALQKQLDLVDAGVTPVSNVSAASQDDILTDFCSGIYGTMIASSARITSVQGLATFGAENVGVMPFPADDDTTLISWDLGIWSNSQHKEEAGAFIEYITSAAADEMWVTEAHQIPLRSDTAVATADFLTQEGNEWLATCADIVANHTWAYPTKVSINSLCLLVAETVPSVYEDGLSVEDALKRAEEGFIAANSR